MKLMEAQKGTAWKRKKKDSWKLKKEFLESLADHSSQRDILGKQRSSKQKTTPSLSVHGRMVGIRQATRAAPGA